MLDKFSGNDASKPFHSHTFADAASGQSMGSTNAQSFGQRRQLDQNRQMVRRYSESSVASSGEHLRDELSKRIEEPADTKHGKHHHKYRTTRQSFNAGGNAGVPRTPGTGSMGPKPVQIPKRNFSEPPGRNYNPFS
jgi:hypothetical protein